jgi:hypothetical protein
MICGLSVIILQMDLVMDKAHQKNFTRFIISVFPSLNINISQTKKPYVIPSVIFLSVSEFDVNLLNTQSSNPHTKTLIPKKSSKSGLIGVWHKDNLYLDTSTIGNRNPHPMNIVSQSRGIRMTPRSQLLFDKSSLENQGRKIISPTHTQSVANKKFY